MSIYDLKARVMNAARGWGGIAAFAFVAPSLGIVVAKVLSPIASPATVSASSSAPNIAPERRDAGVRTHWFRPVSESEASELAAIEAATVAGMERTPLMRLPGEPSASAARIQIIENAPETIMPPAVGVTSIMASRGLPIAVVGGKLLRVGDEVSPGWSIGGIDAEAGTVTLVHETGFEHTLRLRE